MRATKLGTLPLSCVTLARSTDAYPVCTLSMRERTQACPSDNYVETTINCNVAELGN